MTLNGICKINPAETIRRDGELKVFDWFKAVQLIKEHAQPNSSAYAGLIEDWNWTSGIIFDDGKAVDEARLYLGSTWANPTLIIDGEEFECWQYESDLPGWNKNTVWPPEALERLNAVDIT